MKGKERDRLLLQYATAISVTAFTAGGFGSITAWTSPALEHLKSNKSDFPMTKEQISWVAPLLPIGLIIGHLLVPIIINRFNRKWILLISSLAQIIAWILIILAKNPLCIYIARISAGIGYGVGICVLTVFLSGFGTQKNRGTFLSFVQMFLCSGIFFTMLLSASFPYQYMNFTLFGSIIFFVLSFIIISSTAYFQEKNNQREEEIKMMLKTEKENPKSDAKKKCILNEKYDLNSDFKDPNEEKTTFNFNFKESSLWKILTIQANRKAMIIVIFCAAQDVFSGHVVIRYFSQQIFTYKGSFLTPEKACLIAASIKVISALICIQVIDRFKRKFILLVTGILGSFGMGFVGLFFFLEYSKVNVSLITWMPFFGICLYDFMLTTGIGNSVYLYSGELFPNDLKGLAITACKVIYMLFAFLSILKYQILVDLVNTYMIFWIYTINNIIFCFITLKITPETQGKSIEDIQISLKSKTFF